MITLIITLFVVGIIEFAIFLILEYTSIKNNKKKLNDEHDKTINHRCNSICNDNDICTQSNKDERKTETTSTQL